MAADAESSAVCSEIEVLQSIYLDEIHVSQDFSRLHPWEISITLHPATANDAQSQYVCFTLNLSLTAQYPDAAPVISIRNPRGLSDDRIQSIYQTLMELAEAGAGGQVLYQLIEKGKEILTNNNVPHCQCVICLDCFQENEAFTKTVCYHYFHSYCLARYIRHTETELRAQRGGRQLPKLAEHQSEVGVLCPVCREPLTYDLGLLLAAADPNRPLEPYQPDDRSLNKRLELQLIFQRQQEKGGIIDPEAERNRFFISLTRPVTSQMVEQEEEHGERCQSPSPGAGPSRPERAPSPSPSVGPAPRGPPPRPERRGRPAGRGWAEPRRRPRAPAERRDGPPLPGEVAGPPRDPRLTGPPPAAQDCSRPARAQRHAGAPERGGPDRREGGPLHGQERKPWPRKVWAAPRQDWAKGRAHPGGRGGFPARPGDTTASRDTRGAEPGHGEAR